MSNYYAVLGVGSTASSNEIKQAFRRLSKLYHPDTNQGSTRYQNKLFEVIKAYEVLGDERQRKAYDLTLFQTANQTSSTSQSSRTSQAAQATQAAYGQPVIVNFSCNQTYFFIGDVLEISWECKNADRIRLYPLGYMDQLKGTIRYHVKDFNGKQMHLELIVHNTRFAQPIKQYITLTYGRYKTFTEADVKEVPVDYLPIFPWFIGFVAPLGRSSRREYAFRLGAMTLVFLWVYGYHWLYDNLGLYFLVCTMLLYALVISSARRLHDVSRSGFLSLLLLFPYLNIIVVLILLLLKGDESPNRYGRKPKK